MWAVPPTTSPTHLWAAVATTISTSMAGNFQKYWKRERREVLGVSASARMDSPGSWETALVSSRYSLSMDSPGSWETALVSSRYSLSLLFAGMESPGSWVTAWDLAGRYSTGLFLQFARMDSPGSWAFLGNCFSPSRYSTVCFFSLQGWIYCFQ